MYLASPNCSVAHLLISWYSLSNTEFYKTFHLKQLTFSYLTDQRIGGKGGQDTQLSKIYTSKELRQSVQEIYNYTAGRCHIHGNSVSKIFCFYRGCASDVK